MTSWLTSCVVEIPVHSPQNSRRQVHDDKQDNKSAKWKSSLQRTSPLLQRLFFFFLIDVPNAFHLVRRSEAVRLDACTWTMLLFEEKTVFQNVNLFLPHEGTTSTALSIKNCPKKKKWKNKKSTQKPWENHPKKTKKRKQQHKRGRECADAHPSFKRVFEPTGIPCRFPPSSG